MAQAGVAYRDERKLQELRLRRDRAIRFNRMMLRTFACVTVACLFVYISRMAEISAGAKEISRIRNEIGQLLEDQECLESALAENQKVQRIEDEAIGRLGMSKPEGDQLQLVSLNSYISGTNTQTAHDSTTP